MFRYYEDGREETVSMEDAKRLFDTEVDGGQKEAGTDFEGWLWEMERMGILVPAKD